MGHIPRALNSSAPHVATWASEVPCLLSRPTLTQELKGNGQRVARQVSALDCQAW